MNLRQKLAANMRRLREEKVLSQEELAHRAGLHRTYVSMVERLVRNPTVEALEKIAHGLEVDPIDLLKEP